jgi:hypothetical protein
VTKRRFTCVKCEGEFVSGWSEAEAHAERQVNFAAVPAGDDVQLCDDCYESFMRWWKHEPEAPR